jgi:hypothetical protein
MKVAIVLGRGIEGCGVSRYAIQMRKWYKENGHEVKIFSGDKKWGRPLDDEDKDHIRTIPTNELEKLQKELNKEYDVVFYQSLPGIKFAEEYCEAFFKHIIKDVTKPLKIAFQNDHKAQSLARNYKLYETMREMDAVFVHSLTSIFGNKMRELVPETKLLKMGNGFDFDELKHYIKPFDQMDKRLTFFSRFATFKDPYRMFKLLPYMQEAGIVSEMLGIERSIGALPIFYEDIKNKVKHSKIIEIPNLNNEKFEETEKDGLDKIYIIGPYVREQGVERLSKSMFGTDFYNLHKDTYGDNLEYAMSEIIGAGSIPLFDDHWAYHCRHVNGKRFSEMDDFAIYVNKENPESFRNAQQEMMRLMNDPIAFEDRRQSCIRIAKEHTGFDAVFGKMFEDVLSTKKKKIKSLF